jgi:hypothetical protein
MVDCGVRIPQLPTPLPLVHRLPLGPTLMMDNHRITDSDTLYYLRCLHTLLTITRG